MICKHCGVPIRRYNANYTNGWIHEHGNVWCKTTMADLESGSSGS